MQYSPRPLARSVVLVVVLLGAAACDDTAATPPSAATAPLRTEVAVFTAGHRNLAIKNELPGRTSAYRVAEVRPQVNGIILKRLFREGATVKAGEPLYQIDPARYEASRDLARADLKNAEAGLKLARLKEKRYTALVAKEAVSRQTYDEAIAAVEQGEAKVAAAKANLELAQINLNYTKVTSPISGRIGKSAITEGSLVTANQQTALATVTQLDPIYVDVTQSSVELLKLRKEIAEGKLVGADETQAPVSLMMEDGSPYPDRGRLQFSDVTVDESTGSIRLRALFPNPRMDLLPGLFVRAAIRQAEVEQAILVPQQSVLRNPDGSTVVWLVSPDDTVVPQPVTIRQAVGDQWLVENGLKGGDRVIVSGFQKTRPGAQVAAVPFEAANGPAVPAVSNTPR